tara:strand:- start:19901 stop:21244 length:1344 start_codon:yes stop_codon:yes gene_type:complete
MPITNDLSGCRITRGPSGNTTYATATAEQDADYLYALPGVGMFGSNVLDKSYHFMILPAESDIDLTGEFPDNMVGWHRVARKNFNISGYSGEDHYHWALLDSAGNQAGLSPYARTYHTEHHAYNVNIEDQGPAKYRHIFGSMSYTPAVFQGMPMPGGGGYSLYTEEKVLERGDQQHPNAITSPPGFYSVAAAGYPFWPTNTGILEAFGGSTQVTYAGINSDLNNEGYNPNQYRTIYGTDSMDQGYLPDLDNLEAAILAYNSQPGHGTLDSSYYYDGAISGAGATSTNTEVGFQRGAGARWCRFLKEVLMVDTRGTLDNEGEEGNSGNAVCVIGILKPDAQPLLFDLFPNTTNMFVDVHGNSRFVVDHSASHRSLKENIIQVGKSPKGFNIYNFNYKNKKKYGSATYQGVIYDEIPEYARGVNKFGERVAVMSELDVVFKNMDYEKKK